MIKKDELIPRNLKTGDESAIVEVRKELKGHQIFLSKDYPVYGYFQEVPEIYEGTISKSVIEILAVGQNLRLLSRFTIDPVGAWRYERKQGSNYS